MDAMLYAKELVLAGIVALYLALFAYYRQGRWGWYHSRVLMLACLFPIAYALQLLPWYCVPVLILIWIALQLTMTRFVPEPTKEEYYRRGGTSLQVLTAVCIVAGISYAKSCTAWLPLVGILIERAYFLLRQKQLATQEEA